LLLSLPEILPETLSETLTSSGYKDIDHLINDDTGIISKSESNTDKPSLNISGNSGNNINLGSEGSTVTGNTNTNTNCDSRSNFKSETTNTKNIFFNRIKNTFNFVNNPDDLVNNKSEDTNDLVNNNPEEDNISNDSTSTISANVTKSSDSVNDFTDLFYKIPTPLETKDLQSVSLPESSTAIETELLRESIDSTAAIENFPLDNATPATDLIETNSVVETENRFENSVVETVDRVEKVDKIDSVADKSKDKLQITLESKGKSLVRKISSIFKNK
jgi:hypothetical protein